MATKINHASAEDPVLVQAAKRAGRHLVSEGRMSVETLATVSRELMPAQEFVSRLNQLIQLGLEAAKQGAQEPA